jgi:hypothetical protein
MYDGNASPHNYSINEHHITAMKAQPFIMLH